MYSYFDRIQVTYKTFFYVIKIWENIELPIFKRDTFMWSQINLLRKYHYKRKLFTLMVFLT